MSGGVYLFGAVGFGCLSLLCGGLWWTCPTKNAAQMERASPASSYAPATPPAVRIGMLKDELLAKCGQPDSISHQVINNGAYDKEQWSYRKPGSYIYLTNGVVTSMQYAENGQRFTWDR